MMKGKFDLEDYASQLRQITKMGSLSGILGTSIFELAVVRRE